MLDSKDFFQLSIRYNALFVRYNALFVNVEWNSLAINDQPNIQWKTFHLSDITLIVSFHIVDYNPENCWCFRLGVNENKYKEQARTQQENTKFLGDIFSCVGATSHIQLSYLFVFYSSLVVYSLTTAFFNGQYQKDISLNTIVPEKRSHFRLF